MQIKLWIWKDFSLNRLPFIYNDDCIEQIYIQWQRRKKKWDWLYWIFFLNWEEQEAKKQSSAAQRKRIKICLVFLCERATFRHFKACIPKKSKQIKNNKMKIAKNTSDIDWFSQKLYQQNCWVSLWFIWKAKRSRVHVLIYNTIENKQSQKIGSIHNGQLAS